MKRIALLVLALAANIIANEEENIQQVATNFETDVQTVKMCLIDAGTTAEQMQITKQKWQQIKDDEDIDEETKESFMSHGRFVACILEKNDMMKDSKLVLDKILEALEKEQNEPRIVSKEVVTECVNSLNEADQLNREDRAFGFMLCITRSQQTSER
ncbi:uncharacterized protein [Polyergus mexicanus]|uniref:uncharacterized protein n=1 Tax=Polyergus mexicanus TaxID=615972 RepID=UPI0038B42731